MVSATSLGALLASALLVSAAPAVLEERAANPTVTIPNGVIVGTATRVTNQPTVTGLANSYLGVPFADSPPARFGPPTAAKNWSEPLTAQTFPPACLQYFYQGTGPIGAKAEQLFNNPLGVDPVESEDCLYLNVYAPQAASPTNLKPVMFWIFGGNLQFGTASLSFYDGSSLAVNEDVVVVAINYRTNIFGFSNSPEIPFGEQNSGFLDQRFALQWVQDNIKSFGGDPSQVTIFGESAGGYSVKQLLANPPSPLPFRAAIMESQQTGVFGSGLLSYEDVAAHFGCATAPSTLACLRAVAGTDIQNYVGAKLLNFPPVIGDGTYVGSNTLPSILSGKFADVPILIGTNKDEARIFLATTGVDNGTNTVDNVLNLAGSAYGEATGHNASALVPTFAKQYPTDIVQSSYLLTSRILTDLAFTCTTSTFSSAIAAAGRQNVYRYFYEASFPNLALFNDPGAYHTEEIPLAWGTYSLKNFLGDATPTQIALSKTMQHIWAGFAKNPSGGVGWPALGKGAGIELGVLGGPNNPSGESTEALITADYPCAVYDPLIIAEGMAY